MSVPCSGASQATRCLALCPPSGAAAWPGDVRVGRWFLRRPGAPPGLLLLPAGPQHAGRCEADAGATPPRAPSNWPAESGGGGSRGEGHCSEERAPERPSASWSAYHAPARRSFFSRLFGLLNRKSSLFFKKTSSAWGLANISSVRPLILLVFCHVDFFMQLDFIFHGFSVGCFFPTQRLYQKVLPCFLPVPLWVSPLCFNHRSAHLF